MAQGLVDVRTRDEKRHGKMRVDAVAEWLKKEQPAPSSAFEKMYEKAWDPAKFGGSADSEKPSAAANAPAKKVDHSSKELDKLEQ